MTTWHTADLHFLHEGVIPRHRGFHNATDMGIKIVSNINNLVSESDTLYIHGDFAMSYDYHAIKYWLDLLNGQKHLILGNHDHLKPFEYVEMGFWTVHTAMELEGFYLSHDPSVAVVDTNKYWLCGHVHHLPQKTGNIINVGLDAWGMEPVSLDMIKSVTKTETKRTVASKLKQTLDDGDIRS